MLHEGLETKADTSSQREGKSMKRRDFIKVTGIGVAGAASMAAPAIAQSMPETKWRVATSGPKKLAPLYGGWRERRAWRLRRSRNRCPRPNGGWRRAGRNRSTRYMAGPR